MGQLHTHQTYFILSAWHTRMHTHTKIINIASFHPLFPFWEYQKDLDMRPPTICEFYPVDRT